MKAYGLSDVGKVRPLNEDAYYLPKERERFAAVADGMGGHKAGEVASALAIEVFTQALREAGERVEEAGLVQAVEKANAAIYQRGQGDRSLRGMGTTLTALWFGPDYVYLSHVGDSRAYLLRNRALMQLSNDHSLVNELVEKGEITPREARNHPQRNFITRALGTGRRVTPDVIKLDFQPGDAWLLCTDGLTNYLRGVELARIMNQSLSWEDKLRWMVDEALRRGGGDNITALVVPYEEERP